tara:strand:- start:1533 stop:1712 length:180 start_codon:yes stop_codon:yes gene_type:complete
MQFIKKTSSREKFIKLAIKITFVLTLAIAAVYLLNKIDFPTPKKDIEKIISNENFKIVK